MKGLEALERIKNHLRELHEKIDNDPFIHLFEILPFVVVKKELKALEIIIRRLNMHVEYNELIDKYVIKYGCIVFCEISKEEYELLKEVLL